MCSGNFDLTPLGAEQRSPAWFELRHPAHGNETLSEINQPGSKPAVSVIDLEPEVRNLNTRQGSHLALQGLHRIIHRKGDEGLIPTEELDPNLQGPSVSTCCVMQTGIWDGAMGIQTLWLTCFVLGK